MRSLLRRDRGLAWVLSMGLIGGGLSSSCTLTLDHTIACGDGYVDPQAGEECDPADEDSFIDACVGTRRPDGEGACDPVTCQLITDIEQCGVCGDDEVDPEIDEECDGDNLGGARCPGGEGVPICTSDCTLNYDSCRTCGNAEPDPGEECDSPQGGLIGPPRSCDELLPVTGYVYTSGVYNFCGDDCQYSRAGCGYCGNNNIDGSLPLDLKGNMSLPEICDGGNFDDVEIAIRFGDSECYETAGQRPLVSCRDDCLDIVLTNERNPTCCWVGGEKCPDNGSALRCCYELDHPEDAEACTPDLSESPFPLICKG